MSEIDFIKMLLGSLKWQDLLAMLVQFVGIPKLVAPHMAAVNETLIAEFPAVKPQVLRKVARRACERMLEHMI